MKKFNYYLLAVLCYSCIDPTVDKVFDQGINQRTEALRQTYLQALTAPKHGWIGEYAVTHGDYQKDQYKLGSFTCLLKFNTEGRVIVKSDYQSESVDTADTVSYRIDQGWKMELIFENYTVFHAISEIDGFLVRSGFIFNISVNEVTGYVTLSSRPNHFQDLFNRVVKGNLTHLRLRPAKLEDWDLTPIYEIEARLPLSGVIITSQRPLLFEQKTRKWRVMIITLSKQVKVLAPIRFTATGFGFVPPVKVDDVTLSDFTYNADKSIFYDANDNNITIDATF